MTEYLNCEIKDHDLSDGRFVKINIKALQKLPDTIINGIDEQYHETLSFSHWYNGTNEIPEQLKIGNKIKLPFYVGKGYLNKSQFHDVELIEATSEKINVETKPTETSSDELTDDEYKFAESYMNKYEAIAKIKKPDFSLEKLDQCNYKDVVTSCKIEMAKKVR
jgi:hypothetical protein